MTNKPELTDLRALILCEISDFFAGFSSPGEPETPEDMQRELTMRVGRILNDHIVNYPRCEALVEILRECRIARDEAQAELQERRKAEAAWLKFQSMLNPDDPAAPQPAPVVPETLPCPVHLEPGLKFGKGVRTQCMLEALRRRADYYAELEAMTPEQRAEHDAGIAEFKAMLENGKSVSTELPDGDKLSTISRGES